MNIRQCIGEAVPTCIFRKIADNIRQFMASKRIGDQQIRKIVKSRELGTPDNLLEYINSHIAGDYKYGSKDINDATLSRITELANTMRTERAAYYTEKGTLTIIFEHLPHIDEEIIRILEPAAGTGNFIPFLVKKYSYAKRLIIDVVDIDETAINVAQLLLSAYSFPANVEINFICEDFFSFELEEKRYNLVVGNPPYLKMPVSKELTKERKQFNDKYANNLAIFFVEKSCLHADYVAFILPKVVFCNTEYKMCRDKLRKMRLETIVDFGELGFSGINIETVFFLINTQRKGGNVLVESIPRNERLKQRQRYICDSVLPNWVIYRNSVFDQVLTKKHFGVFSVFRDRQITKSLSFESGSIRIIKSKDIPRDVCRMEHIKRSCNGLRLSRAALKDLAVYEFIDRDDVYLVPNMTYYPRMVKKPKGAVPNGSVAILIPKDGVIVSNDDVNCFCQVKNRPRSLFEKMS